MQPKLCNGHSSHATRQAFWCWRDASASAGTHREVGLGLGMIALVERSRHLGLWLFQELIYCAAALPNVVVLELRHAVVFKFARTETTLCGHNTTTVQQHATQRASVHRGF